MRIISLFAIGFIFILSVTVSAQKPRIKIGYVENSNGQYNECGKRLTFAGVKENLYIFVYANDVTEMKINGKRAILKLERSTEKLNGASTKGETFQEIYRAGKITITIRYVVIRYSDNTVWYTGKLYIRSGNNKRAIRIKGSSGC